MADGGHIPGAVVIPNCIQVRLIWTLPNTKTVYNVMHASVAGGFTATGAVAQAAFTALVAAAGWTSWKAQVNSGVTLAGLDLRDMRALNQPIVGSTTGAQAGTGAGTALPPGDALVVTLRTAQAGRGFRGRVYLPGLDSGALAAGGVASGTATTNATAFVTAVQTALTGQGMTLAIGQAHRQQYTGTKGAVHPDRPAAVVPVTLILVRNTIIDHQRRRAGRS